MLAINNGELGEYDHLGLPVWPAVFPDDYRLPDGTLILQPTSEKDTMWVAPNSLSHLHLGFTPGDIVSREAFHEALYEYKVNSAPQGLENPEVLFMGGGPAAGKSKLLAQETAAGRAPKHALTIAADDLRDYSTEFALMRANKDARGAMVTDQEAGDMTKELIKRAREKKMNIILDGLMRVPATVEDSLKLFRDAGYKARALMLTVDNYESLMRVQERFARDGRYTPWDFVIPAHASVNAGMAVEGYVKLFGPEMTVTYENTDFANPQPIAGQDLVEVAGPRQHASALAKTTQDFFDSYSRQEHDAMERQGALEKAEYEKEKLTGFETYRQQVGAEELLPAIKRLGGLPPKSSRHSKGYEGELERVRQAGKGRALNLFRNDAMHPDDLVTRLREIGFRNRDDQELSTPEELWDLLDQRLGAPPAGQQIWNDPQKMDPEIAGRLELREAEAAFFLTGGPAEAAAKLAGQRLDRANSVTYAKESGADQVVLQSDGIARTLSLSQDEQLAFPYAGPYGPPSGQVPRPPVSKARAGAAQRAAPGGVQILGPQGQLVGRQGEQPEIVEALTFQSPSAIRTAFGTGQTISALLHDLISRRIPVFHVVGQLINSPADFAMLCQAIRSPYFESLKFAVLDAQNRVIHSDLLTVGSVAYAVAEPRDIMTALFEARRKHPGARRIIWGHNHPSGQVNPSHADVKITAQIESLAGLANFEVVDSVITNGPQYYSFRAQDFGTIPAPTAPWEAVPRGKMMTMGPQGWDAAIRTLRQGDPTTMHVIYASVQFQVLGIERHAVDASFITGRAFSNMIAEGVGREGASNFFLEFPPTMPRDIFNHAMAAGVVTAQALNVGLLDASWGPMQSARDAGVPGVGVTRERAPGDLRTEEPAPEYRVSKIMHASQIAGNRRDEAEIARLKASYPHLVNEIGQAYGRALRGARETGLVREEAPPYRDSEPSPQEEADDIAKTASHVAGAKTPNPNRAATHAALDGPLIVQHGPSAMTYGRVPMRGLTDIKIIEMPELYALVKEIMGHAPILRKLRSSLGMFVAAGEGKIVLDPRIWSDPTVAAKVMAHELGHLIDWLPTKTLKRGNIIGRLYTLRSHLQKTAFGSVTGVSEKKLREELIALTKWWKPWDEAKMPAWYNDYRKSSKELYADAISVLMNSPADLKQMAPSFWREFFAWLDKKADVKRAFFELQSWLHQPYMDILRARSKDIGVMFGKAEETWMRERARRLAQRLNWNGWVDQLRDQYFDRYTLAIELQTKLEKAGVTIPAELDMKILFDEHPLADNLTETWLKRMWERVVKPMQEADIPREVFGEYLLFSRITADRAGIANPKNHTAKTAEFGLMRMRLDLGIQKMTLLEHLADKFHDYVYDTVKEAADAGLISQQTFKDEIKPNRKTYAAFRPIDHVADHMPAGIRRQIGTLDDVENPFFTTVIKVIAMRRAIQFQRARVGFVNFLKQYFPSEIKDAEMHWVGQSYEPNFIKDPTRGLLEIRSDGKRVFYEVSARAAKMFDFRYVQELNGAVRLLDFIFRRGFYNIWVKFNPAFQLALSPIRDFQRYYINMPKAGVRKLASAYLKAIPVAMRRLQGIDDPIMREMYENFAIATPHESFARHASASADPFDEVLRQFHLIPEEKKGAWRDNVVVRPIEKFLRWIEFAGQVLEGAPKVAAYKVLAKDLGWDPRDAAAYVRNYVGVPNYLRKGRHAVAINAVLPFFNVAVQGMRSDLAVMTGKEAEAGPKDAAGRAKSGKTSGSWWLRWALAGGLYAVIQELARDGLLGDDLKRLFGGAGSYDHNNYTIIPLGTSAGGPFGEKVMYIRIPQDESQRITTGLFKQFLHVVVSHSQGQAMRPLFDDLVSLFGYASGQMPGFNPLIKLSVAWSQYLSGFNPYDQFRGKMVLTNTEQLARGTMALGPMLEMTYDELGIGNYYKPNLAAGTTAEAVVSNMPVVQRLFKVSDYGFREDQQKVIGQGQVEDARLRAALPKNAGALATEYNYLKALSRHRTPQQDLRYGQLKAWHKGIYTPLMEAAENQRDAGNSPAPILEQLGNATKAWDEATPSVYEPSRYAR